VEELALLLEIVGEVVTSPRRTIAFDILTFSNTLFQLKELNHYRRPDVVVHRRWYPQPDIQGSTVAEYPLGADLTI